MKKTPEEIEHLKASWLKDPCWDIEDSEGFEEHHAELLAYRLECEAKWNAKHKASADARVMKIHDELGIVDPITNLYLYTFAEIEIEIAKADDSEGEVAALSLQQANARATLLLAAQVKRVADELEFMRTNQEDEIERQERLALHRQG